MCRSIRGACGWARHAARPRSCPHQGSSACCSRRAGLRCDCALCAAAIKSHFVLGWRLCENRFEPHRDIYDKGLQCFNGIEGQNFSQDAFRSLSSARAMSFDRFRALALCLSIASERSRYVFRSLPSARAMSFDRFRALALCLSIAFERSRCLQIAADVSHDVCRSRPIAADVSHDACRSRPIAADVLHDVCRSRPIAADRDRSLQTSADRGQCLPLCQPLTSPNALTEKCTAQGPSTRRKLGCTNVIHEQGPGPVRPRRSKCSLRSPRMAGPKPRLPWTATRNKTGGYRPLGLVTGSSSAVHARQGSLWERAGYVGADLSTGHSKKRYQRVLENPMGHVERFETCFEW